MAQDHNGSHPLDPRYIFYILVVRPLTGHTTEGLLYTANFVLPVTHANDPLTVL